MNIQQKMYKQRRAMLNYAHALHVDIDTAAMMWIERGCAERWGEYYDNDR